MESKYDYLGKIEFRIIVLENELESLRKEKERVINEIYVDNADTNTVSVPQSRGTEGV